jgi:hypothetical protein
MEKAANKLEKATASRRYSGAGGRQAAGRYDGDGGRQTTVLGHGGDAGRRVPNRRGERQGSAVKGGDFFF